MLSRPAPAPDAVRAFGTGDQVADVRFAGGSAADRPVLVVVHGGFWRPSFDRVHLRPLTEALAAAGWASVMPEYRRVPGRPDLAVRDVHEAVRMVAGMPEFASRRVVLVGHSAGGHLVLQVAAALEEPAGVLALAPVADLRLAQQLRLDGNAVPAFLGEDADARADLDPARLPAPACPVRIVHGIEDGIVPLEVSESYRRSHPGAVLTRVDGGHFALIDPRSAAWPAVLGALGDLG
ncbi:alpha/beta hydrolase [Blastococcus haudaquaticus]|uniref:Alpha/beta hydrolase fold n=1 Tax=Blastococcus haudaquaticus TaxID=1938745 RepID=A0A286GQ63_9ACTN|nr:alpha/beta hydrolase [Blastococcus haudaquaticus]SOD97687.1 alpha/beta hydrolase fold [Blastococcus haudaquaticus]